MNPDRKTLRTYRNIFLTSTLAFFVLFVLRTLFWPSSGNEEAYKSPMYWTIVVVSVVFSGFVVVAAMYGVYAWSKKSESDSSGAKDKEVNAAAKSTDDKM